MTRKQSRWWEYHHKKQNQAHHHVKRKNSMKTLCGRKAERGNQILSTFSSSSEVIACNSCLNGVMQINKRKVK